MPTFPLFANRGPLKRAVGALAKHWPSAGWWGASLLAVTASVSFAAVQAQAVAPSSPAMPLPAVAATGSPVGVAKTDKQSGNASAVSVAKNETQSKPFWKELTPAQQASLKPLAANWASLSEAHKRKWIAFAQNYPSMSPADQSRLHSRMTDWVTLSPQQRTQARLNFAETKTMSTGEKAETWKAYQALSAEEKQRLANQGNKVPPGATSAVKPVPAQKLAVVPSTRKDPKSAQIAVNQPKVSPNTLLPQQPTGDTEAAVPKN